MNAKEKLRPGTFSHPAPLYTQCLLYIMGHLFLEDWWQKIEGIPTSNLAFLPHVVRAKIILLLPAADVAKLEGTSSTRDISMDEIWETLYKERMPWDRKDEVRCFVPGFDTPEELEQSKRIESVSWREAYFNSLFSFAQVYHFQSSKLMDKNCKCVHYDHFLFDLLFGIRKTPDLYQCFSRRKTLRIHNIYRCNQRCRSLTTLRYNHKYSSGVSLGDVIHTMVQSQISLKHISFSPVHLRLLAPFLSDDNFCGKISKCATSIESISIYQFATLYSCDIEEARKSIANALKVIFVQNKCSIRSVLIQDQFDIVLPYLGGSHQSNLKQLEISITLEQELVEENINISGSFKHVRLSKSISPLLQEVLQCHQELELFEFGITSSDNDFSRCLFMESEVTRYMGELFFRSSFKQLTFNSFRLRGTISFYILQNLLGQFFSSPHPVSFTMIFVSCPKFDPISEPLTVKPEQSSLKSLNLLNCALSVNFTSLIPQHLSLKSLKLEGNDDNVYQLFGNLESVSVDELTLVTSHIIGKDNIDDICRLFRDVNAQKWVLSVAIDDESQNTVDKFLIAFSGIKGSLMSFTLQNYYFDGPLENLLFLLEAIFKLLSPFTATPYFKLALSVHLFTEDFVRTILDMWKKFGVGKLKEIEVFDCSKSGEQVELEEILSEMAVNIIWKQKDF
uniref:Uncharacterized protein n=1 Tax=Amphimedon queenslandica TaxID=400682 RepID=A0A1X7TXG6_AMPQE